MPVSDPTMTATTTAAPTRNAPDRPAISAATTRSVLPTTVPPGSGESGRAALRIVTSAGSG
jgi:hypothetical protein